MSHHVNPSGRHYVECDDPVRDPNREELRRCARRSRPQDGEIGILDLARGWRVAPYPDDFDHGATRRSLLDGSLLMPAPLLFGLHGDLHTCPTCGRARR